RRGGTLVIGRRRGGACQTTFSAGGVTRPPPPPVPGDTVTAQVRYRQKPVTATIEDFSSERRTLRVRFAEPVFSVTPGQSLVLYDGDLVLGGGVIQSIAIQ
ncbi:MAG: hypothetical protein FWH21_04925, partial [Kiritimatiellaeota bacterium]|nr:hypothetical protein [Kiritimatiellota bacterium]